MPRYNVNNKQISLLLSDIKAKNIAIPDIQRPFVWKPKDVRDLIDSLYNGYPIGYLIVWKSPEVNLKGGQKFTGQSILIDGQQRVTGLETAICGHTVIDEDFNEKVYRIAFNPLARDNETRFEVQTPAIKNNKKWIPDISVLFDDTFNAFAFINGYLLNNPDADPSEVDRAIQKIREINTATIGVIELDPTLTVPEVTEIFVRINGKGKPLNESDFAMSRIAADEQNGGNILRKAIDYFCHLAKNPGFYNQLENVDKAFMETEYAKKMAWLRNDFKEIYDPDYNDMLRVAFMYKFNRAKLGDLVELLAGRDFQNKIYTEAIIKQSFDLLKEGVLDFMNEFNLSDFIIAIESIGFKYPVLLRSRNALNFAYTLYLILKHMPGFEKTDVKKCVQKWFLFSTLTGRYAGSPETVMNQDLRDIKEKGFLQFLQEQEQAELSDNFWDYKLVNDLTVSITTTPAWCVFVAAQVFDNDTSLLDINIPVSALVDSISGNVHHIFPKEYLKKHGITDRTKINQIANYAFLEKTINIIVSDRAPNDYFKVAKDQCEGIAVKKKIGTIDNATDLNKNLQINCIPAGIENMDYNDYEDFLQQRRKLMAEKIRKYYYKIGLK